MRLTSTNPCSCFTLTQIPQRNHSRMEERKCESFFLAKVRVQLVKWARERGWRGKEGYLYPSIQKLAIGEGLPGDSGYKPKNSGPHGFDTLGQYPDTPCCKVRTFRVYTRRFLVWQDLTQRQQFGVVFMAHKTLYRFSWALVLNQTPLNQVPLDSTAFLYSNLKCKI
jgi:hypothetical protein